MNSITFPQASLPRIRSFKSLVPGGVGLVLSIAFFWIVFNKTTPAIGSLDLPSAPDHAIYQWRGFCRVAASSHP